MVLTSDLDLESPVSYCATAHEAARPTRSKHKRTRCNLVVIVPPLEVRLEFWCRLLRVGCCPRWAVTWHSRVLLRQIRSACALSFSVFRPESDTSQPTQNHACCDILNTRIQYITTGMIYIEYTYSDYRNGNFHTTLRQRRATPRSPRHPNRSYQSL